MVARMGSMTDSINDEESLFISALKFERPRSVDPLQPNIAYKEPNVSGNHSRCSSARDLTFSPDELSQIKISKMTSRKEHPKNMTQSQRGEISITVNALDKPLPFLGNDNYQIKATQLNTYPQSFRRMQRPAAQKNRLEKECIAMEDTRALKRRAQIVPHRLDMPFYMTGLRVPISQRYQLDEKEAERIRSLRGDESDCASSTTRNRSELNEKGSEIDRGVLSDKREISKSSRSKRYQTTGEGGEMVRDLKQDESENGSSSGGRRYKQSGKGGGRSHGIKLGESDYENSSGSRRYKLSGKDGGKIRGLQPIESEDINFLRSRSSSFEELRQNSPVRMGSRNSLLTSELSEEATEPESEVDRVNKLEEEKRKEEYLLQYKKGKRILVGGFSPTDSMKDPFKSELIDQDLYCGNIDALQISSKEQTRAFEAIFNDIDFNSNGKLSFDEMVFRLFSNVSKKDAKLLMQIFDVDKDKLIDRREFSTICALNDRICGFRTESKQDCLRLDLENLSKYLSLYRNLFDMLDQDGDGKIHIDEVMLILSTGMGRDIGMSETIAQSVIDSIDQDRHGYIDFVGFVMHVPFFLRLHASMMNSNDLTLREIQETKDDIHEQLRSRINTPS